MGAYYQAIAVIQQHDPINRRQFYVGIFSAAIRNHNRPAVFRLVPIAIGGLETPRPDWGTVQYLVAAMAFDNARKPPSRAGFADQMARAKSLLPPLVPGPKAGALTAIVTELAARGELDAALQAEAGLEGEQGDVLASARDPALRAISEAQERGGNRKLRSRLRCG